MSDNTQSFDELMSKVLNLAPMEKIRLLEQTAASLEHDLHPRKPLRSPYGLCADLGPAPSAQEIDEARHEMWGKFPREDIIR
jgi:hypothetical protein